MGGNIMSITTTYAWTGSGFVIPSACVKAGVLALMRSLAVEATMGFDAFDCARPDSHGRCLFSFDGWRYGRKGQESRGTTSVWEAIGTRGFGGILMSPASGYVTGEVITIDGAEWLVGQD